MLKFTLNLDPGQPHFSVTTDAGIIPQAKNSFDFKKIPWSRSMELLRHLAAHGSFLWSQKPLIANLFSKVPFIYSITKNTSGELQLEGKLLLTPEIPIDNCDFIVPAGEPWVIVQNQIRLVGSSLGAREINALPRVIDASELKELAQDAQDPENPKVEILFEGEALRDPSPHLALTDRKGAFANLMMEYGPNREFLYQDPSEAKQRKLQAEQYWEKDLLETGFLKKIVDQSHYYCPLDQVGKSISFLLELGWKITDAHGRQILLETGRELHASENNQTLLLKGHLKFKEHQADLSQVLGAFNRRERFIDLGTGLVGFLNDEDIIADFADEIEVQGSSIALKKSHAGLLEGTKEAFTMPLLRTEIEYAAPSARFQGTLRPYQQEGLNWLVWLKNSSFNGILADEMGLGKTVQILAYLSRQPLNDRHLIIVPTSLLFNWERECTRFLPDIPVYRHHGSARSGNIPEYGIILTSYHTLQNDQELFKDFIWDTLILDEAQMVKNPDTKIAKVLYQLKSRLRVAMTGTIIENHSRELWAHFHFLMPGMLGDRDFFEKQLSLAAVDSRYVRKIRKITRPFILRRRKEEVAKDLPPLQEYMTFVEMPESQRAIYDHFLAAMRQGLLKKVHQEGAKKHRMEIFEALLRLRQIACSPLLVSNLFPEATDESGKMQALFIDLETIREEGKKALIFSQFSSMLHLIANKLSADKVPFSYLDGSTRDRETPVRKFQEDPSIPFFLSTLKAGGVGLNLTAADYVLLYDPWWHDAAEAQAISRAHRIGQTKPVIAKRYITLESLEEKLVSLKKAKSNLFNQLLEDTSGDFALSEDDLAFLLA